MEKKIKIARKKTTEGSSVRKYRTGRKCRTARNKLARSGKYLLDFNGFVSSFHLPFPNTARFAKKKPATILQASESAPGEGRREALMEARKERMQEPVH